MGKNPTAIFASVRQDPPDEVKDGVVRDYLAGNKVVVIQDRYGISPGTLYRLLHTANVKLRKPKTIGEEVKDVDTI